jgi:hypothetical protein
MFPCSCVKTKKVPLARLERAACGLGIRRSIHLSYRGILIILDSYDLLILDFFRTWLRDVLNPLTGPPALSKKTYSPRNNFLTRSWGPVNLRLMGIF